MSTMLSGSIQGRRPIGRITVFVAALAATGFSARADQGVTGLGS